MEEFTITQGPQQPPAARRKKNGNVEKKTSSQRKQIFSFLMIVFGFMVLLSMMSYSPADEANGDVRFSDLYKIFTNDPLIQQKAESTTNWLGLFGAILSNFLINSTVGLFAFAFPVLMLMWGWIMLRSGDLRRLVYFTNYVIVLTLIGSAFFGLLRKTGLADVISSEWHGSYGAFFATVLQQAVGLTGGMIVTISLTIIAVTLMIDLDLHKTSERLKNLFIALGEIFGATMEEWKAKQELKARQREEERRKKSEEIEVKRPDTEVIPQPEKPKLKQKIFEPPPIEIPKEEGDIILPDDVLNVVPPLEIKEGVVEKEAELEAPEVEDEEIDYVFPSVDLLDPKKYEEKISDEELKNNAAFLQAKLADFGVEIANVSVTPGPVVTLYELVPATGVKVSKITALSNDLALAMQARGIRIEAPIPGKGTVGVEIPNHKPQIVTIRSILNSEKFRDSKAALPLAMGKTITGEIYIDDLAKMPHVLIAGATGMGKSVGINSIIASLLYRLHPSEVKFILVDPKKIELSLYQQLQHHFLAVSPDFDEKIITQPANAVLALKSCVIEMERRYDLLASAGVRHVTDYNARFKEGRLKGKDTETLKHRFLPYIIVIIDELADLMLTTAKEVEESIARIAQLARAVGLHLVLATQRPSVDVITGVIKANFPSRIAYAVSSRIDSRTIIDGGGAEQLIGRGDMLYLSASTPKPVRIQNAYISTEECEELVHHIGKQKGYSKMYELPSALEKKKNGGGIGGGERDELFDDAARIIVRHQQGSVSLLQRRLSIGYSRAARLVDQLEEAGIVGSFDGSKAREVLIETDEQLEILLKNLD
ncbi:MAG: DNA translocase FtsK 4TM domain-containing protein [Ignavibacteriales bacterium]|nr:DNA translocase FtsK 4TM domain-containing protein [Ignavibacteriales bacterium]